MNIEIMVIIQFIVDIRRFLWNMLLIDDIKYKRIDWHHEKLIDSIFLNLFNLDATSIAILSLIYNMRSRKYFIRYFDGFIAWNHQILEQKNL